MENKFFPEVNGRFGFGMMRLPLKEDGHVDYAQVNDMVDAYLEAGFNYFDTAHGYLDGESEQAMRQCLVDRYPRDKFLLADKLSERFFEKKEDIRPLFEKQLEIVGTDHFDFYLMHSQSTEYYAKFKACEAYDVMKELKAEGKIRHLGISFHDTSDVLEMILNEHPEIEFVQIQYNYRDTDDVLIQAEKNYEVIKKHGLPCFNMEPVKGGFLANLSKEARRYFDELSDDSSASYALRYSATKDNMAVILSGMSNMEQMRDNLKTMKDVQPLNEKELDAVAKVKEELKHLTTIPCTGCRYCAEVCPINMPIPEIFTLMNGKLQFEAFWDYDLNRHYNEITEGRAKASECLQCGACEGICPQKLPIRENLMKAVKELEEK